jgi:hypothetical protein
MAIDVSVTGTANNKWTITSSGTATAPGTITVTPHVSLPQVGAYVNFASAVTKGSNPASTGPYFVSIPSSFTAATAGDYAVSASESEGGPFCTAHPISVGRGGTGGS